MRIALLVLLLPALALAAEPSGGYLFRNGTLVTMTEAGNLRADLQVVAGRIEAIGPELAATPGTVEIDLRGGYLMPGLAEMHAHVPAPASGERYRDDVMFLWLAGGITTVRGMLGDPAHLTLRDALAAQSVLGPRLITSGPSFNGDSVSSPDQARAMVRAQAEAGYDFLKIHPGLTRAEYDAMADQARRSGIAFAGHVPAEVGLDHAIASGQATIDHLDGFITALAPGAGSAAAGAGLFGVNLASEVEFAGLAGLVARLREAGTWVVPTQTLIDNFAAADRPESFTAREEYRYLPRDLRSRYSDALAQASLGAPAARRALDVRNTIIAALAAGGVGLLLGSDSPQIFNVPGFSLHRELADMVAAGLRPEAALRMGTADAARFFGRDDFGTLQPGRAADLVYLRADPTRDVSNASEIEGVMVRGRWLDRATLDAGLADIGRRYSAESARRYSAQAGADAAGSAQ